MLTYKIEPIISNGVAIKVGEDIIPKGIGTVHWSWTDDEVQLNTKSLRIVAPLFAGVPTTLSRI